MCFIVDSADADRFPEAKDTLDALLNDPALDGAPVLFLANKRDLQSARGMEEITAFFDLKRFESRHVVRIQAASAMTGEGIEEGVTWLMESTKSSERQIKDHE